MAGLTPEQDGLTLPEFIAFDRFAKQLIDVDKKWIETTRLVSLSATASVLAPRNPFRIYLCFTVVDSNGAYAYPEPLDPTAGPGFPLTTVGYFREFYPAKDGKLCGKLWLGTSALNDRVLVTETIYRGNTDHRSLG